jgi:hypothetical protein
MDPQVQRLARNLLLLLSAPMLAIAAYHHWHAQRFDAERRAAERAYADCKARLTELENERRRPKPAPPPQRRPRKPPADDWDPLQGGL